MSKVFSMGLFCRNSLKKRSRFFQSPIFIISLGSGVEHFDTMLVTLGSVFFLKYFFTDLDDRLFKFTNTLFFALAYFSKPLGGIIFGYIGDKYGRRNRLALSVLLMGFASIGIALLPTYNQIGIYATLLIVLLRCVQGFSVGAETSGAIVYLYEWLQTKKIHLIMSMLGFSSHFGGLLAVLVIFITQKLFAENLFWRVAFFIGGCLGFYGFYIRRHLKESPQFQKSSQSPLQGILSHSYLSLLWGGLLVACTRVPFYLCTIYMNNVYKVNMHFHNAEIIKINTLQMLAWTFLMPLFALLADKTNGKKMFRISATLIILSVFPFVWVVHHKTTLMHIVIANLIFSAFNAAFFVTAIVRLAELFQTHIRYTGVGLAYGIGSAAIAGLFPFLSTVLVEYTTINESPAFLIIILFLAVLFLDK